jgi:predicted nucleotidyltransferase
LNPDRQATGSPRFTGEEVRQHLEDLADGLAQAGVEVSILLVGGAALSFYYDRDQGTTDVDAVGHPKDLVLAHAAALTEEKGLRPGWLNEAATMYFPHEEIARHVVIEKGTVRVEVAEPEVLLAMKLHACRPQKDLPDLAFLLRRCDVRSVDKAVEWLERYYPEEELSEQDQAIVAVALGEIELPTRPPTLLPAVEPRAAPTACRRWVVKEDGCCVLPPGHEGSCATKGR